MSNVRGEIVEIISTDHPRIGMRISWDNDSPFIVSVAETKTSWLSERLTNKPDGRTVGLRKRIANSYA